ncbi:sialic acid-binding Ig-like lectin 14 isoform X3 [Gymnodraco acuticeps]|uniref:Sialic acid-binding Ig-like lectin 14 isoform X3 n=1 Tax=Gymnodraco acuticeps TaxID=8218 RepID=A0A6P8W9R0_GYMAC|nr:sialic acid-binding Ig-like lectin 14 isoform X3 [Gymnodraco acuticeps]
MEKDRRLMIYCLLLAAICIPVFTGEWKANVVKELKALVTSCVVVPCSFTHPGPNLPTSKLRGIWHQSNNRGDLIYDEDETSISENFRGRTKLLGHLGQKNCTLEMSKIKDHDNGPFCFRIELAQRTVTSDPEKFSFLEDCVEFKMLPDPPKPKLHHLKTAYQGRPYTVTCSVKHTCPYDPPKLTWSRATADVPNVVHKETHLGNWEVESILTIIPEEKDDHTDITCTANFNGPKTSSAMLTLYVKRSKNYNHIIIPTVVAIGTAVIFAVFCVLMVKRYKRQIAALQRGDGSVWNRLSRMSRRIRSDGPGPSRSDQRSTWSRFLRRPKADIVDMSHIPKNLNSKYCDYQKVSKPRFPSPKSQPKSYNHQEEDFDGGDVYENSADLSTYGNI